MIRLKQRKMISHQAKLAAAYNEASRNEDLLYYDSDTGRCRFHPNIKLGQKLPGVKMYYLYHDKDNQIAVGRFPSKQEALSAYQNAMIGLNAAEKETDFAQ